MKFFRYVDNRYQEIALEIAKEQFSAARDGESNALQFVLKVYRFCIAAVFIPKVLIGYVLVNVGLKKIPAPALDILKAQHEDMTAAKKNKAAKKVGFQTTQGGSNEFN